MIDALAPVYRIGEIRLKEVTFPSFYFWYGVKIPIKFILLYTL